MSKAGRVLDLFPGFFRASDSTKLLREVVASLCAPLEEADSLLLRIQRAHRLNVAEDAGDIVRLAAVLNLDEVHFEDLLHDRALPYDQKLAQMRERVRRIARLHLLGLGTPWAVMEAAAIFLNAAIVPERAGDPLVKGLDANGFSHKAVLEFSSLPARPREPLYLHEAPLRRRKLEPAERWSLDSWSVANATPEPSAARITIQGIGERTVRPSVFCTDTQEGVVFDGIVPDGGTLVIDVVDGATIDKHPVNEWLVYFRGAITDFSREGRAALVTELGGGAAAPFDGDLEALAASTYRTRRPTPATPPGPSQWRFKVASAVCDAADFDYCALSTPAEPIGSYDGDFQFDHAVFDYSASGVVGMSWDERVTCSFKLLLPAHVPRVQSVPGGGEAGPSQAPSSVSRVGSVIPRFKAAGIQALVDTARDAWILGASVLRVPDAQDGEGVEFHATRLISPRTEMFVP
jgi:hypothetical protein